MPHYGVRNKRVIAQKILRKVGVFLSFVGKPFFWLLTIVSILLLWLFWAVGNTTIRLLTPKLPEVRLPKLKLPRIILPRLVIPQKARLLAKLSLFVLLFVAGIWFFVFKDLPRPGELITRDQIVSTKIYDREGRLLFKIFRNQNRTLVPLEEIPLHTRQATIAIEDAGFYSHPGFSIRGIVRSIWRNLTRGQLSGGSTITQQLVKNALLSPEKTLTRKAKEIVLAIQAEIIFSKDQILEMYLNEVAYGGAAYGIEEAAQLYFAKPARDLTLAEAALLAGLPRAPTTYSPFGANPGLAKARQLEVLSRMVQEGYITTEEADLASKEQLVLAPQRTDIKAPHFVMYVKQLLVDKYGERMVEEGGLEVVTSLDLEVQEMAEKIVSQEIENIRRLRATNGATLVTSPATGEILAMVGSRNYFDQNIDGNFNVTTAQRQPGSSIKPVNYSFALESGRFTAATILPDTPITYYVPGTKPYSPRNYDNRFHGNIPLRVALASSYNVPAVKVLNSLGVKNMIEQGEKLGITTWQEPSRFGLSLTLGGGEVKMTDMAVVYGTLANYGKRVDLQPILKVTDYRGKVLEEWKCEVRSGKLETDVGNGMFSHFSLRNLASHFQLLTSARAAEAAPAEACGEQVLDPRVAFILTDILRDNAARTPAFGPSSLLNIPGHAEVAVKTGTTQNLRDNWAIGYTKDYVVASWVGNNDNTPMAYVASGVTGATPIWHKIMRGLLEDKPNHSWEVPDGIAQVPICSITGTLACEGCPTRTEYFIAGTQPAYACSPEQLRQQQEKERGEGQIL